MVFVDSYKIFQRAKIGLPIFRYRFVKSQKKTYPHKNNKIKVVNAEKVLI